MVTAVLKVASWPTVMVMAESLPVSDRTLSKVAPSPTVIVAWAESPRTMPLKVTLSPAVIVSVPGDPVIRPTSAPSSALTFSPVAEAAFRFSPFASTPAAMFTVGTVFAPNEMVAALAVSSAVRSCSNRTSTGVADPLAALMVMLALTPPSMMKTSPGWAVMVVLAPI